MRPTTRGPSASRRPRRPSQLSPRAILRDRDPNERRRVDPALLLGRLLAARDGWPRLHGQDPRRGAGTTALFHHMKVGDSVRASGPLRRVHPRGRPPLDLRRRRGRRDADHEHAPHPRRNAIPAFRLSPLQQSRAPRRDLRKELRAIERRNPNFHFHYALTREAGRRKLGFRARDSAPRRSRGSARGWRGASVICAVRTR